MKKAPLKQEKKTTIIKKKESATRGYEKPKPKKKVEENKEVKKPAIKPYRRTALEEKNLKDAAQNKNMRPPFEQKKGKKN